jgi:hypothetical protein
MNDAIAIYLNDGTLPGAFVARWRAGYRTESADGVCLGTGGCAAAQRTLPGLHKTPYQRLAARIHQGPRGDKSGLNWLLAKTYKVMDEARPPEPNRRPQQPS